MGNVLSQRKNVSAMDAKNVCTALRTTCFYDPGQYKDDTPKTLIVNVVTSLDANGSQTNPFDVPIEMDFTEFMNESEIDEFKNKIYTATLTAFIQHFPGCTIQNKKGEDVVQWALCIHNKESVFKRLLSIR